MSWVEEKVARDIGAVVSQVWIGSGIVNIMFDENIVWLNWWNILYFTAGTILAPLIIGGLFFIIQQFMSIVLSKVFKTLSDAAMSVAVGIGCIGTCVELVFVFAVSRWILLSVN
jgi:hypothetical protein